MPSFKVHSASPKHAILESCAFSEMMPDDRERGLCRVMAVMGGGGECGDDDERAAATDTAHAPAAVPKSQDHGPQQSHKHKCSCCPLRPFGQRCRAHSAQRHSVSGAPAPLAQA